jgi:hypothetical protein
MGKIIIAFLLKLPIDKLLGLWYNGNSDRLGVSGPLKFTIRKADSIKNQLSKRGLYNSICAEP